MGDCSPTNRVVPGGESERISELLTALSDRRRRFVLYCLYEYETPMAIADVTDEIVRHELDAEPTNAPEVRDRVYTNLYHYHLPKLAEADAVVLDLDESLVRLGPTAGELEPILDRLRDEEELPALSDPEQ